MTTYSRRSIIRGAALAVAGAFGTRAALSSTRVFAQAKLGASAAGVKALVYDVFGTCTDWRNGVARDAERILKPLGYNIDWHAFADAWRVGHSARSLAGPDRRTSNADAGKTVAASAHA